DRTVRVDLVGVRVARAAPDAQEAEVAVHGPLLRADARAQQLARAVLGATLAPGVIADEVTALIRRAPPRAPRLQRSSQRPRDARPAQLEHERQQDQGGRAEREQHGQDSVRATAPAARLGAAHARAQACALCSPPAARGKKITRSASRGTSAKLFTSSASRRPSRRSVGTAAHMPASSSRRKASISSRSCSGASTSPSASRTSPWPGLRRSSFISADYGKRRL